MSASPRTRRLLIRSPTEGLRLCRTDKAATARWRRGPSEQEGDLKTETGLNLTCSPCLSVVAHKLCSALPGNGSQAGTGWQEKSLF